jgi:tetratricopeptide (TPR) repeat protein
VFLSKNLYAKGRLLPALLLLLSGCTSLPPAVQELAADAGPIELEDTPFYPQQRYQCGPAALTTVLTMSGANVSLPDIVDKVYLPEKQGSLQVELLAATRTSGRLPYVIDGSLSAIWSELAAGRAVVVLQNLGVAAIPRWHYAVVVGVDPLQRQVVLRSGTDLRRVTATTTFLRTWQRGNYWGMVALRPDELPVDVDQGRYFEAIVALEEAGQADEAALAWQTALRKWPNSATALFGLGNIQLAAGQFAAAEKLYMRLLARDEQLLVVRNNLALALAEQQKFNAALAEIAAALAQNSDAALASELENTQEMIKSMLAAHDE